MLCTPSTVVGITRYQLARSKWISIFGYLSAKYQLLKLYQVLNVKVDV
jgi:hypothetical protein